MTSVRQIIPKIKKRVDDIKDALVTVPPEQVLALQAEARAYLKVLDWLKDDVPDDASNEPDFTY